MDELLVEMIVIDVDDGEVFILVDELVNVILGLEVGVIETKELVELFVVRLVLEYLVVGIVVEENDEEFDVVGQVVKLVDEFVDMPVVDGVVDTMIELFDVSWLNVDVVITLVVVELIMCELVRLDELWTYVLPVPRIVFVVVRWLVVLEYSERDGFELVENVVVLQGTVVVSIVTIVEKVGVV